MDKIIAFLSQNIFIVVVIVGFITSLISKSKRKNAQGMPDFNGRTATPQRQSASGRSDQQQEDSEGSPVSPSSSRYDTEGRSEPGEEEYGRSAILTAAVSRDRSPALRTGNLSSLGNAAELKATREAEPFRMPEGEELRRAIVIAEILGPPRAKRPHRPNNY